MSLPPSTGRLHSIATSSAFRTPKSLREHVENLSHHSSRDLHLHIGGAVPGKQKHLRTQHSFGEFLGTGFVILLLEGLVGCFWRMHIRHILQRWFFIV